MTTTAETLRRIETLARLLREQRGDTVWTDTEREGVDLIAWRLSTMYRDTIGVATGETA